MRARRTATGVLAVPVQALVALLEGGHAVEVVNRTTTGSVDGMTALGLFANGSVEVSGDGLGIAAGFARLQGWLIVIPPIAVGGEPAALLIAALAGLYPAIRGARISPTGALRSV